MRQRVAVAGAGIFGVTGALELARRGHRVTLCDSGPLPHPLASSTDISKVVRLEYGADLFYTEAVEEALVRWRALNARWGEPLFHETGVLFLTRGPMERGSFEAESFALLTARGHALERLDEAAIAARFPRFGAGALTDGFYDPEGGWAESGRVVAALLAEARAAGVELEDTRATGLLERGGRVTGLSTERGELEADFVVVAAGAFTPSLLASMSASMRVVGQPVLHFAPREPARFAPPHLVPFGADISRTGWYGFGASDAGVVKIAHHGAGVPVDPAARRDVPEDAEPRFRAFLRDTLPELAEAPLAGSRLCLYCDSADGDPWIARVPDRPGLVVASGGSGHAFKLAPLLGEWIACEVEDGRGPARLGWRDPSAKAEAARFVEGRAPSR